ncbi:MAG: endo-1,4-beta-xylanase [Dysgonamonadaceae bacterium]|jgi:hypothetical protein|nr:endo-1,4-beta-xylanase [Dysgonamonadaceae bacterium]
MKYINKLICVTILAIVSVSCIDEYDCNLNPAKPEEVAASEYLNSFDMLKKYAADQTAAPFQLGAYLSPSDFLAKELPYSMLCTNFQALEIGNSFTPVSVTNEIGDPDFSTLQTLVEETGAAGLMLYGGALLANTEQRAEYLNGLIAPIVIPIVPESGVTTVKDFEDDALGTIYSMTGNSASTVEEDPDGQSGHVLRVGSAETPANRSYPQFEITLPEGRVLGDYTTVSIDFRGGGSSGLYGSGMVMAINGKTGSGYQSPSGYGCSGDVWGRGMIVMEIATIPLTDEEKQSAAFTLYLGSGTGAGNYFIDNIKMAYEKVASGKTVIDFESDALSKEYPMTGNSVAKVEQDPDGVSGKVLHVGETGNAANYSYPKFQVTLPSGQKLGNCTTVSMDFRGTGSTGLYGSGMRLRINGREKTYNSPSGYGCGDGRWGRGMIAMNLADFELTDEEKQLTSFELATGSGTGAGDYYIDNITLIWKAEDIIIEKTAEEKKDILTAELTKWIGGMLNAGSESVKAWNIVSEPLNSNADGANTFYWKDYLGDPDYARTAVKIARENSTTALELFVSATFELDDNSAQKAEDLIALIAAWEADNVTKINGINVLLHLNYSKNQAQQQTNEATVGHLLEKLAASGKQIRISDLQMSVSNAGGTVLKAAEVTADDRLLAAGYYTFVFKKYFSVIAKEKQYGISFAQMSETKDGDVVCPWNVNNNRTEIYIGIVDGLKQE